MEGQLTVTSTISRQDRDVYVCGSLDNFSDLSAQNKWHSNEETMTFGKGSLHIITIVVVVGDSSAPITA